MIIKKAKEWLPHSSNGCCNPDCEVCHGAPCHTLACEICHPESNYFTKPDPMGIAKTGFDKWLEEMLKHPVFKEEYEKAKKEIAEYDRLEKEAMEQASQSHRQVGGTSQGSKNKKRVGRSKKGKKR